MVGKHFHERDSGHVRKAYASKGDDVTFSRFVKIKGEDRVRVNKPKQLWLPNTKHESVINGTSVFWRRGVKKLADMPNLLVSGHNNVKIGRDVRKGKLYRGYWIYTLTLEERRTCPRSCHHWQSCYGNNMPYARRVDHTDPDFMPRLALEIAKLCNVGIGRTQRKGVLLRLHALGDFYSSEYVAFWAKMLRLYPNLAIYGYTARTTADPIGRSIAGVKRHFGLRFAIRWSDGGKRSDCTISIGRATDPHEGAFVCPEQTGLVDGCGKCGLCWNTKKNVAFVEH
jgi:hypothetical protein